METSHFAPRVVIAGLAGDSGKTAVSLALLRSFARNGVAVRAFKKGPDYIDPAWLSWASGAPARNLDSWLMPAGTLAGLFAQHALTYGLNLIEGNRGLFDGFDTHGTHSTAELAKALRAPVVLVISAAKMTRTAAALVLGCQHLDPNLRIGGIILNRVNGRRHERVLRSAIEESTGVPVLGVVPQFADEIMPQRHLGLVTPEDYEAYENLDDRLAALSAGINLESIYELARSAGELKASEPLSTDQETGRGMKIAYIRDAAFSFYYADNLEALERTGAEIVPVSSFTASQLPDDIDALYIGGGFPEVHAARISRNASFLRSLKEAAEAGLPIYAECGGLMLLSRSVTWRGMKYSMANVFGVDIDIGKKPKGHGYVELVVSDENPFFAAGTVLRGHEFHYSCLCADCEPKNTACSVKRGVGLSHGRDALLHRNVWAAYTHLHAAATPEWERGMISAARRYRESLPIKRPAPFLMRASEHAGIEAR